MGFFRVLAVQTALFWGAVLWVLPWLGLHSSILGQYPYRENEAAVRTLEWFAAEAAAGNVGEAAALTAGPLRADALRFAEALKGAGQSRIEVALGAREWALLDVGAPGGVIRVEAFRRGDGSWRLVRLAEIGDGEPAAAASFRWSGWTWWRAAERAEAEETAGGFLAVLGGSGADASAFLAGPALAEWKAGRLPVPPASDAPDVRLLWRCGEWRVCLLRYPAENGAAEAVVHLRRGLDGDWRVWRAFSV